MDANSFIRDIVNAAIPGKFTSYSALAAKAGINQGNFSDFMNKKRQGMTFETAWKLFQVLGLDIRPVDLAQGNSQASELTALKKEVARQEKDIERLEEINKLYKEKLDRLESAQPSKNKAQEYQEADTP